MFLIFFVVFVIFACAMAIKMKITPYKAIALMFYAVKDNYRYWLFDLTFGKYGDKRMFNKYGLDLVVAPIGGGKTLTSVDKVVKWKKKFKKDLIVYSNIPIDGIEFIPLYNQEQLYNLHKDKDGNPIATVFFIDEIQNIYRSDNWKDFPDKLFEQFTYNRKDKKYILATSQVFSRTNIKIREYTQIVYEVIASFGSRLITEYKYRREEYERLTEQKVLNVVFETPPYLSKDTILGTDKMRRNYDTYLKITKEFNEKFIKNENTSKNFWNR